MKNHPYKNFVPYTVSPSVLTDLRVAVRELMSGEASDEGELEKHTSRDPAPQAWRSAGLVQPTSEPYLLVEITTGTYILAVQFNERILPAKVRDEHVRKKVEAIEEREGRKVHRKEYAQLREEVEFELLPKAFIRRSIVYVMFTDRNKLFVFTSSAKRADDTLAILRNCELTAGCRVVRTVNDPSELLDAVADCAERLEAADAAVLKGENKRTIRIKDRDIYGDEVQKLLEAGYSPSELRMNFHDENVDDDVLLEFTLNDQLFFKRVQFSDFALESRFEAEGEDANVFTSFALLVANHYSDLVDHVVEQLGGLLKSEQKDAADDEDDEL